MKKRKYKRGKNLSPQEFKNIKTLLDQGIKKKHVAFALGRSYGTVNVIGRFKTFKEYQTFNQTRFKKPDFSKMSEPEPHDPQPDPLVRMADALERLATAWEAKPRRFK